MAQAIHRYEELRQRAFDSYKKEHFHEAIVLWNEAIELCAGRLGPTLQLYYMVAESRYRLGEFEEALRLFKAILEVKRERDFVVQMELHQRISECEAELDSL